MDFAALHEATTNHPAHHLSAHVRAATPDLFGFNSPASGDLWLAFIEPARPILDETSTRAQGIFLESALFRYLFSETSTNSQISIDCKSAKKLAHLAGGQQQTAAEMLSELRRLLGFTWIEIADLLSVDRRSIHSWNSKAVLRKKNRQRVEGMLTTVKYIDRGSSEENRRLLHSLAFDGRTFGALLVAGEYELVRTLAGEGEGRPTSGTPMSASWLSMHGPRSLEPLSVDVPDEAKPLNRAPARGKVRRTTRRA